MYRFSELKSTKNLHTPEGISLKKRSKNATLKAPSARSAQETHLAIPSLFRFPESGNHGGTGKFPRESFPQAEWLPGSFSPFREYTPFIARTPTNPPGQLR
jgi:hypothetical protein